MPFFARPDLSNEQFKQLSGSTLTLSGQTQIINPSGLTISDGSGSTIVINAKGASIGNVLTFDGTEISLQLPSSGASTGIYTNASPTTCTVGGLSANTQITGCTIGKILEMILVPTINPSIIAPFNSLSISPSTTLYEVGASISITGTSLFNRGCITPQYCGTCCYRSGLPTAHVFSPFGLTEVTAYTASISTGVTFVQTIGLGGNVLSARVAYSSGETAALNSSGSTYLPALTAGTTGYVPINITGIYPYFYGTFASSGASAGGNRPAATAALITGGTKVVAQSVNTICINFGSTSDDYIWFATPTGSTSKTKWFVDALNNGNIGGAVTPGGNLFPALNIVTGVTTTCWSGQAYKLYISNYQTAATSIMELRNT